MAKLTGPQAWDLAHAALADEARMARTCPEAWAVVQARMKAQSAEAMVACAVALAHAASVDVASSVEAYWGAANAWVKVRALEGQAASTADAYAALVRAEAVRAVEAGTAAAWETAVEGAMAARKAAQGALKTAWESSMAPAQPDAPGKEMT